MSDRPTDRLVSPLARASARKRENTGAETRRETSTQRSRGEVIAVVKNINRRIAAEISWSRTYDRSARTRPAREAFLKRFEKEVDPDGTLPAHERRRRADHAKRAYMLQLAKRAVAARKMR
jgi:hypothetical protein